MNVGSLFTGIGGFDLGLERAGMQVLWQAESDPYCQRVLARHWPGVPCYPDVRQLVVDTRGRETLQVPVPYVDVLCGGFPCQDLSVAGRGAGIDGARSGLWSEFARLIGELRPRYVIVENVPALLARGLGRVLGDLAACGYDAEWDCISASAVGAPHRRDRVWVVAYPNPDSQRRAAGWHDTGQPEGTQPVDRRPPSDMADASSAGLSVGEGQRGDTCQEREAAQRGGDTRGDMADADSVGRPGERLREGDPAWLGRGRPVNCGQPMADADSAAGRAARAAGEAVPGPGAFERLRRCGSGSGNPWTVEPAVGRVANGIPGRVDRLRALGNALVPQIAEWIGLRILDWEAQHD